MYKFPTYAEANLAAAGIFKAGRASSSVKPLQVYACSEPNLAAKYLTVPAASNHGSRTAMEEDVVVPASSPASLPTEVNYLTDAALWLYAAQMLEELAASAAEESAHEQKGETARQQNTNHHTSNTSAPDIHMACPSPPSLPSCSASYQHTAPPTSPKPSARFDTSIKCHSSPACESLDFETIQDYQKHLMSHVATNTTSPTTSRRRSSKASTAAAQRWPGQRLQKKILMSPPQHRRSLPTAARALAMDHHEGSAHHLRTSSSSSLTSQMASLSIRDHYRRTDSMTGAQLSRSL